MIVCVQYLLSGNSYDNIKIKTKNIEEIHMQCVVFDLFPFPSFQALNSMFPLHSHPAGLNLK